MADHAVDDRHVSDLVVSPEQTLALIRPHLPCACSSCTATTLMMAAGMALGQRYAPNKIGRAWAQIALAGERIAEITAALRAHRTAKLRPGEADALAREPSSPSRCQAFRARGAH